MTPGWFSLRSALPSSMRLPKLGSRRFSRSTARFFSATLALQCALALCAQAQTTTAGKIAFSSDFRDLNSEIYLMNLDGSGLQRLTYHADEDTRPALSPDGSRVAFVSRRNATIPRFADIFTVNIDGSDLQRLTDGSGEYDHPVWSPDGSQIAFFAEHRDQTKKRGIYRVNAGGGIPALLVEGDRDHLSWRKTATGDRLWFRRDQFPLVINTTNAGAGAAQSAPYGPAISADGKIAATFANAAIDITDIASGAVVSTVTVAGYPERVAFSADGKKLIFETANGTQSNGNYVQDMFSVNLNGTNLAQLTRGFGFVRDVSTGPGMTVPVPLPPTGFGRIVGEMAGGIWTINPTGWDLRQVAFKEAATLRNPAFSPNGDRIAYDADGIIFTMNADGSQGRPAVIPSAGGAVEQPAWSPSGNELLYVGKYDPSNFAYHERIYVSGTDGRNVRQVAGGEIRPDPANPGFYIVGDPVATYLTPSWNPNAASTQILFFRGVANFESTLAVKQLDAPPASEHFLVTNGEDRDPYTGIFFSYPVWNPTGTKIVLVRRSGTSDFQTKQELMVMDANGGNLRNLTQNSFGAIDESPTFSPSGTEIAFLRNQILHTMNADGSGVTSVGSRSNRFSRIHWGANFDYSSPDGQFPEVAITSPAPGTGALLTKVTGIAQDPALNGSGVGVIWVRLQRLSDGAIWNPGAASAASRWGSTAASLATRLLGSASAGEVQSWEASTLAMGGSLPDRSDLASGDYKLSAYAVDRAGNASPLTESTFTAINPGTLGFSSAAYSVSEKGGAVSPGAITVRRTGGSDGTVSVDYSVIGYGSPTDAVSIYATPDLDFTGTDGTLTFAPGEMTKTITVPVIDDTLPEPSEQIFLSLGNPTGGAELSGEFYATLTILDDDTLPPPNAPVINSLLSANGRAERAFTYAVRATKKPTSFAASGLPSGLRMNSRTGVISGTPQESGSFNVSISATNSAGTGSATLVLKIGAALRADLSGAVSNLSFSLKSNGSVQIRGLAVLRNTGTEAATNFRVKPMLSNDTLVNAGDVALSSIVPLTDVPAAFRGSLIASLKKGAAIGPVAFKIVVPAKAVSKLVGKYILIAIDPTGAVAESDDANNTIVIGPLGL